MIRKGKISSVNYEYGMAQVTYQDKGRSVTSFLPVLHHGKEYYMPQIGENVAVIHLENGTANGFILGGYWNSRNKPFKSGEKYYYKKIFDSSIEVEGNTFKINSSSIIFQEQEKSISVSEIIERLEKLECKSEI